MERMHYSFSAVLIPYAKIGFKTIMLSLGLMEYQNVLFWKYPKLKLVKQAIVWFSALIVRRHDNKNYIINNIIVHVAIFFLGKKAKLQR